MKTKIQNWLSSWVYTRQLKSARRNLTRAIWEVSRAEEYLDCACEVPDDGLFVELRTLYDRRDKIDELLSENSRADS